MGRASGWHNQLDTRSRAALSHGCGVLSIPYNHEAVLAAIKLAFSLKCNIIFRFWPLIDPIKSQLDAAGSFSKVGAEKEYSSLRAIEVPPKAGRIGFHPWFRSPWHLYISDHPTIKSAITRVDNALV